MAKKKKILKETRVKKKVNYEVYYVIIDLSAQNLQARTEWNQIFKLLKEKKSTAKNNISSIIIL